MAVSSELKHAVHCTGLFLYIAYSVYSVYPGTETLNLNVDIPQPILHSFCRFLNAIILLCSIPITTFVLLGLVLSNPFKDDVPRMTHAPLVSPYICFRMYSRGINRDGIQKTVNHNIWKCLQAEMIDRFRIEVVSEQPLNLDKHPLVKVIVVPSTYRTRRGSLHKARAFQYCLENGVSPLRDSDWVVHLEDYTQMTTDSVRGILNFVNEGTNGIGKGVITFAQQGVGNPLTTVLDFIRVTRDYGYLRAQFSIFKTVLFDIRGSFMVINAGLVRKVTFDHGPEGSLKEDLFFALQVRDLYPEVKCGFIAGTMHEPSPVSVKDSARGLQWVMEGSMLTLFSSKISIPAKLFLGLDMFTLTASILSVIMRCISILSPFTIWTPLALLSGAQSAVAVYGLFFGAFKSLDLTQIGLFKYIFILTIMVLMLPFLIYYVAAVSLLALVGLREKMRDFNQMKKIN